MLNHGTGGDLPLKRARGHRNERKTASHNFPDGSIFTIGFTIGYL